MSAFVSLPQTPRYVLADARLPRVLLAETMTAPGAGEHLAADLVIADGRLETVLPAGAAPADLPRVALRGGLVFPRFVDGHTHLDKGHISGRRPNPDGTFLGALTAVAADREANWSAGDVARRMDFALRCAFAHGTGAIRTHLDSVGPQTGISWPVFAEMRRAWAGRIDLQAAAIYTTDMAVDDEPQFRGLVKTVAKHGGVLGGVTYRGEKPSEKTVLALARVFEAAKAEGLDLDFHVDESGSEEARTLGLIAEAALKARFRGRIVAGHCCSLALYADDERADTISKLRDAGVAVMSLPMCNMYLQDRVAGRTPRWRGVAPLHELDAAGVPVMIASDNTRDPFYAYGDLDMIEVFREALRILHFDHSDRPWLRLIGRATAEVMGFAGAGVLTPGMRADLVLVSARSMDELVSRPQADRVVLLAGKAIDTTLPDYRDLD